MHILERLIKRIEDLRALDRLASPLAGLVGRAVESRLVRNALSGTAIGHPLHPVLTDLPIGAWSMAAILDTVGGRGGQQAADLAIGVGIVSALPTAVTGLNDWSDTFGPDRRVGTVHAGANSTALGLYVASLLARRAGNRERGKALGWLGLGAVLVGGYLGGHLSYSRGVNVNRTAFEHRSQEWTAVMPESELGEGQLHHARAGDASVLVVHDGGQTHALASTCTHLGGPLHEGQLADGCVTCPWHGSTFRLADGGVVRGPASAPQPVYETRVRDGQVEVRAQA